MFVPSDLPVHVAYRFNRAAEEYELLGIWSKKEDAEAFGAKANEGVVDRGDQVNIVAQRMGQVIEMLVRWRLGQIADRLAPQLIVSKPEV